MTGREQLVKVLTEGRDILSRCRARARDVGLGQGKIEAALYLLGAGPRPLDFTGPAPVLAAAPTAPDVPAGEPSAEVLDWCTCPPIPVTSPRQDAEWTCDRCGKHIMGDGAPPATTGEPAALEWRSTQGGSVLKFESPDGNLSIVAQADGMVRIQVDADPDSYTDESLHKAAAEGIRIYRAAFGPRLSQAEREALLAALEMAGRWSDDPEHDTTKLNEITATLARLLEAK